MVQIISNNFFNLFVTHDKELWAWGKNNKNAFGMYIFTSQRKYTSPYVSSQGIPALLSNGVVKVTASEDRIVTLLGDGRLSLLGRNNKGSKDIYFTQIASTKSFNYGVDTLMRLWRICDDSNKLIEQITNVKRIMGGNESLTIIDNNEEIFFFE